MNSRNDSGIAMVLTLLLTMALTIVGASLMFLAQTETYGSLNYRLMSQARYGAESAVHKAVNYLLNTYATPGSVGDPLANYNTTVSPVTYNNQPVVLSAITGVASNYPVAAVSTAFNTAAHGTLVAGNNVQYFASATLMSMRQVLSYGTGTPTIVQTWQITGDGTTTGTRAAFVEVSAVLERQVVPAHNFAAFATKNTCGALKFTNGTKVDSYDSGALVGGLPVLGNFGGDVGTNGNLTEASGSIITGSLSTPRVGVGACTAGNVTAQTASGGATVLGGIIQLPQPLVYPSPDLPNPLPPTTNNTIASHSTTCAGAGIASNCTTSGGIMTLTPTGSMSLGNLIINNDAALHLNAGTYNLNSFRMNSGTMTIDSGPVIFNIVGTGQSTPINLNGGDIYNLTYSPSKFQMMYAGTGSVLLRAGASSGSVAPNAQLVYAPNAPVTFSQQGDFYGSIVGLTVADTGGGSIKFHYDRTLQNDFFTVGNFMLSSFTWKKS